MKNLLITVKHQGRNFWLAKGDSGLWFLSASRSFTFQDLDDARRVLEAANFFDVPRSKFKVETGIETIDLFEPEIQGMKPDQAWIDEAVEVKKKPKATAEGIAKQTLSGIPQKEAIFQIADKQKQSKEEIKKLKARIKQLEAKDPTPEACLKVLAKKYNVSSEAIQGSIQTFISGAWFADHDEPSKQYEASEIDAKFCEDMSQKIKDFILHPERRKLIGIMAIEKAAGVPISTISNFFSGSRERIPLHHIGAIVKQLQLLGFKG